MDRTPDPDLGPTAPPVRAARAGRGAGRRARTGVVVVLLLLVLCGCQVKVAVHAQVANDGSGTLTVGVGLDEKALQRLGDPATNIKTADMTAAGWSVAAPAKEADGLTWIRASKPFANTAELTATIEELSAPQSMFKGFTFTKVEDDTTITYRLVGTLDPTKGITALGDADLSAKLNGDAFGGNLAAIEAEEGRPIADMVTMDVSASVADGPTKTYPLTFKDTAATPVDVATVEQKPPPLFTSVVIYGAILVGVVLIVAMLVRVRRQHRP